MGRPVRIAGLGRLPALRANHTTEAALVQQAVSAALADAGLAREDVGFYCSGSSDYVMGRPFSFTMALDGIGPWPPVEESHVEMDGAWALYEAWVRLQHGDIDTAVVYAYGKASLGDMCSVLGQQLDPYTLAPLAPPQVALAALQARTLLQSGMATERDLAEVVHRCRLASLDNPWVPDAQPLDVATLLAAPHTASPLRAHDASVGTDGAVAVVLAVGDRGPRIEAMSHIIDAHQPGMRDLARPASLLRAAERVGAHDLQAAELHVSWSHQQVLIERVLGLGPEVQINSTGGSLVADTPWVAGLSRFIDGADRVQAGADRVLVHATAGPCLQHNLLCVLVPR